MPARSIGSGTISFGLVSIPIRVYVATHSEQLSFNMLHAPCGTRIKQQLYCPHHEKVVERSEIVKGYQFEKDRYVTFTDEELRALEAEANRAIDIHEFVPLAGVDPIYFEDAHYLGPDKGAEKAYHLLAQAMRETGKVALAQYVRGGKEHLVLVRPYDGGLVLHTMHYADEVRSLAEVDLGGEPKLRPGEVEMARKLVQQLSTKAFRPAQYHDQYRERVQEVVQKKVAGEEVTAAEPEKPRAQVIDLIRRGRGLLARKVPARKIGRVLESLRRQIGNRPLPRLSVYADGERVVAWDGESRWQPESGQFLFNFEAGQVVQRARRIAQLPAPEPRTKLPRLSADEWCDLGVELEDGSPLEARAAYHHALDLNPAQVIARINLGRLLHAEGKLEGAESHYREALRHEPGNALAWYNLGVLLEDHGRPDQALPCYEHAVRAAPSLADAHCHLALLSERGGRKQAAVRHCAIFRRLAPQRSLP